MVALALTGGNVEVSNLLRSGRLERPVYLEHIILECIDRIERYCGSGEERLGSDELIQDGVLLNLQVLTESSRRISAELKSRHS